MEHEEARAAWVRHDMGEIDAWCRHIATKVRAVIEMQGSGRMPWIDQSESIFDICVVFNRLAQLDQRKGKPVESKDLTRWLSSASGWPLYVAEAFWYCVRNPTMHLGRAWIFADHARNPSHDKKLRLFADIHPGWSYRGPDHTIPPSPPSPFFTRDPFDGYGHGWSSSRGDGQMGGDVAMWQANAVAVTFFMPGLLEVLGKVRDGALADLRAATHPDLEKLVGLNAVVGHLYSEEDPADHLAELDISDLTR